MLARRGFGRVGRPGLIGTMARTAVVAGTATAVVGGVRGHQQNKQPQPDPAPAAGGGDQAMGQLEKLAEMHGQGLLSDDEFAAAKSKLLGL